MKNQLILIILSFVLHQAIGSSGRVITDCYFPEEGNEEYVQLICKNGNETDQRDNCYSMLFEDDSQNDERSNVTKLATSGCGNLREIFKNFTNLIELDISSNKDENLLNQFLSSSHLEIFKASNISLNEIPASFFVGMPKLTLLDFSFNSVKSVYRSIFDGMHNLSRIDLSNNQIHELSMETFSKIEKLNSLNLSFNALKQLDLNNLTKYFKDLEVLNLEGNELINLGNVTNLSFSKLSSLGISNNHFNCDYLEEILEHLKFDKSQFIGDPRKQTHHYCSRNEMEKNKNSGNNKNFEEFDDELEVKTNDQRLSLYQSDPGPLVIICISVVVIILVIWIIVKIKCITVISRCFTPDRSWNLTDVDENASGKYIQKTNSKYI